MTNKTSVSAMKCLPKCRIQCTSGRIVVGSQEFQSASEALLAYLQQFDEKKRTKKQQDAYELLLSKQAVKPHTAVRTNNIDSDLQERLQRIKIQKMKQAVDRRLHGSALQQEVEEALSKSASLLKHVNEDTESIKCVSDIGSLTTEALLTIDPYSESRKLGDLDCRHHHVYSYRTQRGRSRTIDSVPLKSQLPKTLECIRRSSVDSLADGITLKSQLLKPIDYSRRSSLEGLAPNILKSPKVSVREKLSHVADHNRSRSAPPLPSHRHHQITSLQRHPSWVDDLDISECTTTAPSWVKNLEAENLSEPDWSRNNSTRNEIPKWVEAAENLDISGYSDLLDEINQKKKKVLFSKPAVDTTGFSNSLPGLNFSDLNISEPNVLTKANVSEEIRAYSQKVLALEEERNRILNGKENSLTKSNDDVEKSKKKVRDNPYLDAMYLELSRSSQLQTTLDKYLEELDKQTSNVHHKSACEVGRNKPRCSSMETCSSSAGKAEIKSDITGASPINKYDHLSVTGVSDDLPFIPTPAKPASHTNHAFGVVYNSHRMWDHNTGSQKERSSENKEQDTHKSPTLTGSQQPGSMEALKNMLFKLQAEESSTKGKEFSSENEQRRGRVSPISLPALKDYNFVAEPGGQSLERALIHLNRLKNLVHSGTPSNDDLVSVSSVSASATSLLSKP